MSDAIQYHCLIRVSDRQLEALKSLLRESIIDRMNEALEECDSEGAYSSAAELCELAAAVAAYREEANA